MAIYPQHLLDHYKNPRNCGMIRNPDFHAKENNIFCGDSVEISGTVKNKKIADIKFSGRGCVVSQAAASLITEFVKGKSLTRIERISIDDIIKLLGVTLSPTRKKCGELPLIALKKGLGITK